jgi:hypothetical protein
LIKEQRFSQQCKSAREIMASRVVSRTTCMVKKLD